LAKQPGNFPGKPVGEAPGKHHVLVTAFLVEFMNTPASSAEVHQLRQQMGAFGSFGQAMHHNQVVQEARADFEKVVEPGNAILKKAKLPVSEEFVRRWLISEGQLQPLQRRSTVALTAQSISADFNATKRRR
jgi:hypothetical protein